MKKRLFSALLLLLCAVFALASCGEDSGNNVQASDDGIIFDASSELYVIADPYASVSGNFSNVISTIDSNKDSSHITKFTDASSARNKHEIVFGNTDRPISVTALGRLERMDKNNDDDVRYLIYSDGNSLAVVYDEDSERIAVEAAIGTLVSLCDTDKLVLEAGVVKQEMINICEYYEEIDREYKNELWENLAHKVGGEVGDNFVYAMKELYSLYTNDMVAWLANLYEPYICVCNGLYGQTECEGTKYCGTSGFYYSNSARDNIGYLPDVESTYQALTLLDTTGISDKSGGWENMLDDEMIDGIVAFVRSIQREDGYFVHPQWTDPGTSRISRDLSWSVSILRITKESPYYDTPTGVPGMGAPKSRSALTGKLSLSSVSACSKVMAVSEQAYLAQLKDIETFKKYLEALDVKNDSYSAGNTLTSMSSQISARDRQLGLSGEGSFYQTMIDHLNACQNPENGTWYYKDPADAEYDIYYAVNGLMKVTGVYGRVYPIQYVDKAIETAISAITYEQDITGAVDIYNPWFALTNIFDNLDGCGGDEGLEKIEEIRQRLYESASETLTASRNKISGFKKEDGSFSYHPDYSSATSQGCAAAVPNSVEGDINGNVLSSSGLLNYIYTALGLKDDRVPLFGETERYIFLSNIRELDRTNKPNVTVESDPEDFESYDEGEVPPASNLYAGKVNNSESSLKVVKRKDGMGNSLQIDSKAANTGDYVHIKNPSRNQSATTLIFRGDFKLDSSTKSYPVQIFMGSAYMFSFRVQGEKVRIVETSSATEDKAIERDLGVEIPLGEWFSVKVEYYKGDHDSVRIKFYLDRDVYDDEEAELIAVTDNYYDREGEKLTVPKGTPSASFTETNIYVLSDAEVKMEIDNLCSYVGVEKYIPSEESGLVYNIDKTGVEKTFGFNDGLVPEELVISGSGITVASDNTLTVSSASDSGFVTAVNEVAASGDCISTSFELLCADAETGNTLMTLTLGDDSGKVTGYAFVLRNDGEKDCIAIFEYNGKVGSEIYGTEIPVGKKTSVRLDHYADYRTTIIYINGEFVATSKTLYEGGNRRSVTESEFRFIGGTGAILKLDDLKVERNSRNYLEEVKPEFGSKNNDFEGSNDGIIFGAGSSVKNYGGSKTAELDSSSVLSEIKIPVHKRSKVSSAIDVQLDAVFRQSGANGISHRITVTDSEGNMIFGVVLAIRGENAELYEITRQGEPRLLLASFKANKSATIGFEVYTVDKAAYIYLNGKCLTLTECFPAMENLENEAVYLNISAATLGSVLCVDNVKCDSLYLGFESKSYETLPEGDADTDEKLTFDKSALSSLPQRLFYNSNTSRNVIKNVKTVLNEASGEYSNVLIYNTSSGSNDSIGVQLLEGEDLADSSCVTFEADFKMDIISGADSYKFWFFLSKDSNAAEDIAYQVIFIVRDGKLCFEDRTANSGYNELKVNTSLPADAWHHMKLEYFAADASSTRIRMSIDGEAVYVSQNYFGNNGKTDTPDAKTGITKAFFYSMGSTVADLYLDNMVLYGSDAACNDTVGAK